MSKLAAERLTALGLILGSVFFLAQSFGWPGTSGTFPQFTGYVVILLALIMIARSFFTSDPKFDGEVQFDFSYAAMKPLYVMVLAIGYSFAIFRVGFYASSFIFYFLITYMTGIRNYKVMAAVALVLFPVMYFFFTFALGADLPEGFLI
jgi:hypothetical protein